jgi:hypothetical protein
MTKENKTNEEKRTKNWEMTTERLEKNGRKRYE